MKKFIVVVAVLALTLVASVAMAEVTVSGSVDIRSLFLNNTADHTDKLGDRQNTTQDRFRVNIDGKHDNVKGRITFENDWEQWGTQYNTTAGQALSGADVGVEARPGQNGNATTAKNKFGIREGWLDFVIPGAAPAHVKVGHQFLQLGNGWFFRSNKYGSDAWLVGLPGKNTIAFVDVKAREGAAASSDDIDAYVLLDNYKIDDTKTVGVYWAHVEDRRNVIGGTLLAGANGGTGLGDAGNDHKLDNIGLWFNGKLGPVNLQAEIDIQKGEAKGTVNTDKLSGTQFILQANMPVGPASINASIAQGSGQKYNATKDFEAPIVLLDADPHYTVVYEYFTKTACTVNGSMATGLRSTGFCNTTALNLGGSMAVTKWLTASLDFWMLTATEKVTNGAAEQTDEIGNEIDLVLKFKLYDQLTWNWQIARLMAGKAYDGAVNKADAVDAIQGILSYKF